MQREAVEKLRRDGATNLRPRAEAPLGFVGLVGRYFGPRGNGVAAGTLGHFTVLWRGGHKQPFIHSFMQRLTTLKIL